MNGAKIPRMMSIFIIILLIFTSCTHVFMAMGDVDNDTCGRGSPQVELDVGRGQEQESENNDLSGSADEFAAGTPGDPLLVNGTLSTDADIDWFKITVAGTDPGILNVSLTAPLNNSVIPEYEFTVYEQNDDTASKSYIYGTDSGWQNAEATMMTSWAAGPGYYFVRIKVKDLTTVVTGDDYQFNFTFTSVPGMNVESELLDKVDANDEFGDADAMNLTGYPVKEVNFFGTVRSDTDHDWFKLNITGASAGMLNISFETFYRDSTGTHNGQKLKFTLYGPLPSGTETEDIMLYGEDTGAAGATLIQGSMVPPGDYLLKVLDETGTGFSKYEPYHLYINYTPVWNEDPSVQLESELSDAGGNDNSTTASPMVLTEDAGKYNGTIFGNIDATSDEDWFNFTLPGGIVGDLTLTFDTPYVIVNPTYWYVLYRNDRMGNEFLNVSGVGSTSPSFQDTLQSVREGEYYIKVSAASVPQSAVIRAEPYSLHISFEPNDDLPVELEHSTGRDNNEPDNAENITMLPPGDGRPHHLGEIYGTMEGPGDMDYYIFNFTDDYVGTLTIYVQSPNHVPSTLFHYYVYGPDSVSYQCGSMDNYGSTGQQSFTIPGGIPGTYYLKVYTDLVFDMAHLYYVKIEFEPEDTSTYQVAGKITGSVLNNFTSQGIQNVQVEIWNGDDTEQWGEFTSDASGDYITSSLPKQDVWINVNTNGYAPYSHMTTMTLGADQDIDIRLDPTFGNLEGKVYWGTYAHVNYLVPNATVEIVGTDLSTLTDANGEYDFTNVPTGTYNVKFSKEDYLSDTKSVQILESQTAPLEGYLTRITGNIIVFLRDGEGEIITQQATVELARNDMDPITLTLSTWLPNNYTYGANNLLIGNYTLTAAHQDYSTITRTVRVFEGKRIWINLTLSSRSFIVEVTDNISGAILTSTVTVKLYSLEKLNLSASDETGILNTLVTTATYESYNQYFRFYGVENGEYLLNITDNNWKIYPDTSYLPVEMKVTVEDRDIVLNISLVKPGVRVFVKDENNESVTGASVKLIHSVGGEQYLLDADFTTPGLYYKQMVFPVGLYTLTVDNSEYQLHTEQLEILGYTASIDVTLYKGRMRLELLGEIYQDEENRIMVSVFDNNTDDPLEGVTITVTPYDVGYKVTEENGKVELTIYANQEGVNIVTITATLTRYATVSKELTVIVGAEPTSGMISGTVKVSGYDTALGNLKLELYHGIGFESRTELDKEGKTPYATQLTDASGKYVFSDVPFGDYSIAVGKYQNYRYASTFQELSLVKDSRFLSFDLWLSSNNDVEFPDRNGDEYTSDPHKPYDLKTYSEYRLTDDGHRFIVWVRDVDNDEPEYVKLEIAGKNFTMKPMGRAKGWVDEYKHQGGLLPPMSTGRYYAVTIKDSSLDTGKYSYRFIARDFWSDGDVVKESDDEVEITSLREILFRDNMKSLGVLGVLCVILLVIFLVANKKAKKYFSENTNKELTVSGLDYNLKELEIGASGDMVGDLNNLRREYLEGKVDSAEFIKRLK